MYLYFPWSKRHFLEWTYLNGEVILKEGKKKKEEEVAWNIIMEMVTENTER